MSKVATVVTLTLGSAVTDLVLRGWVQAKKAEMLPYEWRPYIKYVDMIPWQGISFGLFFGIAASIAFRGRYRIGMDEIFGAAIICGLSQFITPYIGTLLGMLLALVKIPTGLVMQFIYASLLAVVVRGILTVPISGFAVLGAGLAASVIFAFRYIPDVPFNPGAYWYLIVGFTISLFAAKDA